MISSSTTTPTPQVKDQDVVMQHSDADQQKLDELIAQWSVMTFEDSAIPSLAEKVLSNNSEDLYYGLIGLRKLLAREADPPIQPIIDANVVPKLMQLISPSSPKKVQLEAAWCLTNLCSGTTQQTQYVIENGAIPAFLSLLKSDDGEIVDQSVWGLGNIAGDSNKFRDFILQQNGVEELARVLQNASSINLKRNGAWALSNLCRGKPLPPFELVSKAIPPFCGHLGTESDTQVLGDILWGLSYLTGDEAGIDSVLSFHISSKLMELLCHNDLTIVTPTLRIVGNIISGNDEQAGAVLKEKNLIPQLFKLAENSKKTIRREVFWILSNITAGTPVQFETIMGNPAYIQKMIHIAKNDAPEVKKEAIWTLSNSTATCTPAQIIRILNNGVFACLIDLLDESDEKLLLVALEGIRNCLKWGKEFNLIDESGDNKFMVELEMRGGVEKIESLQCHQSNDVYQYAVKMLETFFSMEGDEEEDITAQPIAANGVGFKF